MGRLPAEKIPRFEWRNCHENKHLCLLGVIFLAFPCRFGYHTYNEIEREYTLAQLSGGTDEQILPRNLASVRIQQKTNPVPDHRELHRFVLRLHLIPRAMPSGSGRLFLCAGSILPFDTVKAAI